MTEQKRHHTVWADRLGLNKVWNHAIVNCMMTFGTTDYRRNVNSFYHLLVDIDDAPLLTLTNEWLNTTFEKHVKDKLNAFKKENPDLDPMVENENHIIQVEEEEIRDESQKMIFDFILQLLEKNGFGFYKSEYDGEVETW